VLARSYRRLDMVTARAIILLEFNVGDAMTQSTGHAEVFCSFCGKSQHDVRCLIEGGCRNPALSQCVFICDECVKFSAQIISNQGNIAKA